MGMEMEFYEGVQNARRLFANGLVDSALQRARYGSTRKTIYQGRECFAIDRRIPPDITDPDILEMLYDQRDHYLRDDQGRLVYLTEAIDPPVALTLAVLASQFEAFQPHSSQSIEVVNRGEMGVLHVSGSEPKEKPVQIEHKSEIPAMIVPSETIQRAHGLPIEADLPVEAPVDRTPAYSPPAGSSKIPLGPVKIFRAEAAADPPEGIGPNAAPADPVPAVRVPTPDIMLNATVREAMRKNFKGERADNAVQQQIMQALTLHMTPEKRIHRLRELVGDFHDADDRSEGIGPGPSGPKGFKVA
jgi:hypothetical protein